MPAANDEDFCLTCAWLRDHMVDPVERAKMAEILKLMKPPCP
jgi:hypothetical protein